VRLVRIREPRTPDEAENIRFRQAMLAEGAQADNHTILGATHWVMRGEEIVGYVGLAGIPTLNIWLDSKRVHPADSKLVVAQLDALMSDRGLAVALVPCDEHSPFEPHMERLGYEKLGRTVLYLRRPPK
jgi:hypothetical protein